MKVVDNDQSSEAHEINADILQHCPLYITNFLLYINDLLKKIFRSLVNIYPDNISLSEYLKNLDDQSMAANFSTELSSHISMGGKTDLYHLIPVTQS